MAKISKSWGDTSALITYTRSGETRQSASSTSDQEYDFLDFLGIAQSLKIDFLPIIWQPALDKDGEGGTAEILQALVNVQMTFAFKRLKHPRFAMEESRNLRALIAEISVLGHPAIRYHPNVANIEGVCWDVVDGGEQLWPVLVFEKTRWGDLNRFMTSGPGKELDTKNRLDMLFDVALAVRDLHTIGVIHGDIKPENVLVVSENEGRHVAKVIDFGYSTLFTTDKDPITMPNSGLWTAPERHHREILPSQARKMDAYSFGMLCLWALFYNKEANRDRNFKKDLEDSHQKVSDFASQLLRASLDLGNRERQDMQKVFRALHLASPAGKILVPHEDFQITLSLHQLTEAHYGVRYYIAKCLEQRGDRLSTSRRHTLNLAFCYKLGFGIRQDMVKNSQPWLSLDDVSVRDLEHMIEQAKNDTQYWDFQNSTFRKFFEQDHFSAFDLSQRYREEQRLREAESQYQREVETMGSVLGDGHLLVQDLRAQLCSLMESEGRWNDAEKLQVRMIEIDITVNEGQDAVSFSSNLAMIYKNQGRWKEAETLQMQIIETSKREFGPEHLRTLNSIGQLAVIYESQGRWDKAEEFNVQVTEIRKRVFGIEHSVTLTSIVNLAAIYLNQGRWKEAEELQMQVTDTSKRVLGAEHPDTLISMDHLASTYGHQRGRVKEAEELRIQLVKTSKSSLGAEHPDTLTRINNLASTYWDQKRWREAEELQTEVMETSKRVLGADHPETLTTMSNLASIYLNQKRWEEAEELGIQVMKTMQKAYGEDHPHTLVSINNLMWTYREQKRWGEAEELQVQAMEISKRTLGAEHPDTLNCMDHLSDMYSEQGRREEAEELEMQVDEIKSRLELDHNDS